MAQSKSQKAMFAQNKVKVNNYLSKLKRKFPSMSGATAPVISSDTKINDTNEVRKILKELKREGSVKQYKTFPSAVEFIPKSERK